MLGVVLVGESDRTGGTGADSDTATPSDSGPRPVSTAIAHAELIVDHSSAQAAALDVSQGMFDSAPIAIVAAEDSWEVASYSAILGVPVLLADSSIPANPADSDGSADATESGEADGPAETADASDSTESTKPSAQTEPESTPDSDDGAAQSEASPAAEPIISQQILDELERLGTQVVLLSGIPEDAIVADGTYDLRETAPSLADSLGVELSYAPEPEDVQAALDGLGTTVYGDQPSSSTKIDEDFKPAERILDVIALTDGAHRAALGSAVAAGAKIELSPVDPRGSSEAVAALAGSENVVAIFEAENPDLSWQLATAASGAQLPGGDQLVFDGKRYVALYGSPHSALLGVLGEQGTQETIVRAEEHADMYRGHTDDQVIPALEIIVTVASGAPGDDGNYSNEWGLEGFIPLIEAAQDAGQYVVLDFQPGRSDFLTQVKMYEQLLEYPHVGVALDPEWRLGPDEMPLTRIGHVEVEEVNEVVTYLADFTRERNLPQKMLILHQFQVQMLRDIDQVDQSRSELAILIHADGQGSQGAKQDTWTTLLNNAPHIEYWGWKNFYDEDIPMLDPVGTYQVVPLPHFVSYQ